MRELNPTDIKELHHIPSNILLLEIERREKLAITNIIQAVCNHFTITRKDLEGKSRVLDLVEARAIVFYILHKHYKISQLKTGKILNKNHTTVLHHCKNMVKLMSEDVWYNQLVANFIKETKTNEL